jgi:putative hemolysin
LQELFELLDITEDEEAAGVNTVGGWALSKLGHIPEAGEAFTEAGFMFTVLEMDGRRLKRLAITRANAETEAGEDNPNEL